MKFELVKNEELTENQLYSIASLKAQHWLHPVESQIEWMRKNYNCSDTHIILINNNTVVGYVAIAALSIVVDGKSINALGASCLCVDKQYHGRGYGMSIMDRALEFARDNNKPLCLLCKEKLVALYNKCGYKSVAPYSISVEQAPFAHIFMVYDDVSNRDVQALLNANHISIDRNF